MNHISIGTSGRRILLLMLLFVCVGAGYLGYGLYVQDRDEVGSDASDTLVDTPEATYTTLTNEPVTFATYRGKVRVVHVWASWSPQSPTELAALNELAATYDASTVAFLAMNRNEPPARAKAYLDKLPEFTHLDFIIDETDAFFASVEGYAMPETIVYDADGTIVLHTRGTFNTNTLRTTLDTLLEKS